MILMVWFFLTLYEHFKGTKFSKERVTNNKIVFIAMILPNIKKAIAVNCFEKNHSKILCNIRMNTPFYSKVVTNLTRYPSLWLFFCKYCESFWDSYSVQQFWNVVSEMLLLFKVWLTILKHYKFKASTKWICFWNPFSCGGLKIILVLPVIIRKKDSISRCFTVNF